MPRSQFSIRRSLIDKAEEAALTTVQAYNNAARNSLPKPTGGQVRRPRSVAILVFLLFGLVGCGASEEQLDAAREAGFAVGRNPGLQEGKKPAINVAMKRVATPVSQTGA
jgi:hypothetical protein